MKEYKIVENTEDDFDVIDLEDNYIVANTFTRKEAENIIKELENEANCY